MKSLQIQPIAAFDDNYFWVIHNQSHAIIVDPGAAEPVQSYLRQHQLTLAGILLTHHHADHTGGVAALLAELPVPVYGSQEDKQSQRIPTISHGCQQGSSIFISQLNLTLQVIEVPGHTSTHIAYYCPQLVSVFCGDTLFAGGCGRLFEGTPAQMHASLAKLAALPPETNVYCAHEYTLSNLRFALAVEPENQALVKRMEQATITRQQNQATVPSCIALELATNPFLRTNSTHIIRNLQHLERVGAHPDEVAVFAAIRLWKDKF